MSTISDEAFLQNLALSCLDSKGVIRGDGTTRGIIGFIRDYFNGISKRDHYDVCSKRLNDLVSKDCYSNLSPVQRVCIYFRIESIAKKCGVAEPDKKTYLGSISAKEFLAALTKEDNPHFEEELNFFKVLVNRCDVKFLNKTLKAYTQYKLDCDAIVDIVHSSIENKLKNLNVADEDFKEYINLGVCLLPKIKNNEKKDSLQELIRDKAKNDYVLIEEYNSSVINMCIPTNCKSTSTIFEALKKYAILGLERKDTEKFNNYLLNLKPLIKDKPDLQKEALILMDDLLMKYFEKYSNIGYLNLYESIPLKNELFSFVNEYINVADKSLAMKLKIKFGNFACDNRSDYKNLLLSEGDKKEVLKSNLEKEVKEWLSKISDELDGDTFYLHESSAKPLAKLLSHRNMLNESDLKSLREKIQAKTKEVIDWDNLNTLPSCLYNALMTNREAPENYKYRDLKLLFRYVKILQDLEEDVPLSHWYHCTKVENMVPILKSGKILVERRCLKGAWVSSQPEIEVYGRFAFAFSKGIEDASIQAMRNSGTNSVWRGLQSAIPFQKNGALTFIACDKHKKQMVRNWVKEHGVKLRGVVYKKTDEKVKGVISLERLKLMQSKIIECLGNPYAPSTWKLFF